VRILGHRSDIQRYFAAADVFYLSSREDPFPSVVLEALATGLPIVGHEGCGGCDDLIARHGTLVGPSDPLAAAAAIRDAFQVADDSRMASAQERRQEITQNFRFDDYAFALLKRLKPPLASVSAVVPSYNYAPYIGDRLRSIFNQTHPMREVIVLDDASTDDSIDAIQDAARSARRLVDLRVSPKNSGSPFVQWRRGAELARGDYVWIAEADDLAAPELVERLVARMDAAGSALGFSDSRQIDEDGRPLGDSYSGYLDDIEPGAFDTAFDMEGPNFLSRYLAIKNVILNVSAVVFRREELVAALREVGEELQTFHVAGDWRLYTEICARGGGVSYVPDPMNSHRRHRSSVTHALKVETHLAEIARMHALVAERVPIGEVQREQQAAHHDACRRHLMGTG
jgi:cellulose synthase/poly-beta-1,6-N-acetylglucosamine synthase-like glycosyltransferase